MQQSRNRSRRALAWCAMPALALACFAPASATGRRTTQAQPIFTPAVTIMPEVLTPQGQPRLYPIAGGQETVWQPGMPISIGDRVVLKIFAATGNATVKEMRVRVDNAPLRTLTGAPWAVEIDTKEWQPGYHSAEVFVQTTDQRAPQGSTSIVLFVRAPTSEAAESKETTAGASQETIVAPDTAVAGIREAPGVELQQPAHPGKSVELKNGVPLYRAALDIAIHSTNRQVEQGIRAGETARVAAPILFQVLAGSRARRYIYALTRDGREFFRSEPLSLSTMVRLQPKTDGTGLLPGEVSLWVWAGDEEGNYGAPDRIRVEIALKP